MQNINFDLFQKCKKAKNVSLGLFQKIQKISILIFFFCKKYQF